MEQGQTFKMNMKIY